MENILSNKGGGQPTCQSEIRSVLRDYQLKALDFMVERKAILEYDDMG